MGMCLPVLWAADVANPHDSVCDVMQDPVPNTPTLVINHIERQPYGYHMFDNRFPCDADRWHVRPNGSLTTEPSDSTTPFVRKQLGDAAADQDANGLIPPLPRLTRADFVAAAHATLRANVPALVLRTRGGITRVMSGDSMMTRTFALVLDDILPRIQPPITSRPLICFSGHCLRIGDDAVEGVWARLEALPKDDGENDMSARLWVWENGGIGAYEPAKA